MLSVIILDNGEPNVIKLTYENLYRELKDIEGFELVVARDWFSRLQQVKNQYVCLVEADCLVSSGYFTSMMGLIRKNAYLRKSAIIGSSVGVNSYGNRFFGYEISEKWSRATKDKIKTLNKGIEPVRTSKSLDLYPVQVAYMPGAILRMSMLKPALDEVQFPKQYWRDLTRLSATFSLYFWQHGGRVYINPNMTYVTTENYVNDLNKTDSITRDLIDTFHREGI